MKKEIWGVNVIGRQGVNAENDFSIGQSDDGKDVVVKIQDTEISGEEFATLKEIAEGGPVPGGSGAIIEQDLDAIGFIPVANTYYQQKSTPQPEPTLQAFAVGQVVEDGLVMHFDTTKGEELKAYLATLEYQNGFYMMVSDLLDPVLDPENPPSFGIFAEDMSIISSGHFQGRLILAGNVKSDFEHSIVYADREINLGNMIVPAGFQNLDENGEKAVHFEEGQSYEIALIQDTTPATWNGIIAGYMPQIPQSQFTDGVIYFYDGEKYNAVTGGAGGSGDYNDLENIPIINLTENKTTVLSPFAIGDEIKPGDKIHFDTTKKDELATYLSGLTYGDAPTFLFAGDLDHGSLVLMAMSLDQITSGMKSGYLLTFGESQDAIVFSTVTDSFEGVVLTEGFMNLDEDGNFTLNTIATAETIESLIDSANAWNGTIINKADITVSYDPQPEDGKFYKKNGQIYKYTAAKPAELGAFETGQVLSEGDKIHFDTSKESELVAYFEGLEYSNGQYVMLARNNNNAIIGVFDLTTLAGTQGYWLFFDSPSSPGEIDIIYSTVSVDLMGVTAVAGYQNLDENGDYTVKTTMNPVTAINDTNPPTWNGTIIGTIGEAQPELFDKVVLESELSGGGEKHLYRHDIEMISSAPNTYRVYFTVLSNNGTAVENAQDVVNLLDNSDVYYSATGYWEFEGHLTPIVAICAEARTVIFDDDVHESALGFDDATLTLHDYITQLI